MLLNNRKDLNKRSNIPYSRRGRLGIEIEPLQVFPQVQYNPSGISSGSTRVRECVHGCALAGMCAHVYRQILCRGWGTI